MNNIDDTLAVVDLFWSEGTKQEILRPSVFCDVIKEKPKVTLFTYRDPKEWNQEKQEQLKASLLHMLGELCYCEVYPKADIAYFTTRNFKDIKQEKNANEMKLENLQFQNFYNPFHKNKTCRGLARTIEGGALVGTGAAYGISLLHSFTLAPTVLVPAGVFLISETIRQAGIAQIKDRLGAIDQSLEAYERFKTNLDNSTIDVKVNMDAANLIRNSQETASANPYTTIDYIKLNKKVLELYNNSI